MAKDRLIVANRIITPDGTMLESKHRHDYVEYTDKNGQYYSVDGGTSYLRRGFDKPDYKEASLYDDSPFEDLREGIYRGGRGKDGTEELKYVKLSEMSDEWIKNVIEYEEELRPNNIYILYFKKELKYRKKNGIQIFEK